jgi:hypothetical protein
MAICSYILGHKYYPIPYQIIKIGTWILSACVLVYFSTYIHTGNTIVNLLIDNSIILVWLAGILLLEKRFNRLKA